MQTYTDSPWSLVRSVLTFVVLLCGLTGKVSVHGISASGLMAQAATVKVSNGLTPVGANPDANGSSWSNGFSLSTDGTKATFESEASNLVPGDTNGTVDVFVYDLTNGVTTRASVSGDGIQGDGSSGYPSISGDGSKIVFWSTATNLVSGDTNNDADIFVHDLTRGTTTRVSVGSNGNQSNGSSWQPSLSADGTKIAFESSASNLVSGDTNKVKDIFVRDLTTGTTTRVNVDNNGNQSNGEVDFPRLSGDGSKVAFDSYASNLVSGDTNGTVDVFVRDLTTNQLTYVNVSSNGTKGNKFSSYSSLSADGTKVSFISSSTNLVPGGANNSAQVYVRDLKTGITKRASVDSNGIQGEGDSVTSSLSADGSRVVFSSDANNLVQGDDTGRDVFVHDMRTGLTVKVNVAPDGGPANSEAGFASLNGNGTKVAYTTWASNLVKSDTNNQPDVFVSDVSALSISDATNTEGDNVNKNVVFTLTLSQPSLQRITVAYHTVNSTASAGKDYDAISGTLTFEAGQTTKNLSVPISGDTLAEDTESFFVNLSNAKGTFIGDGQARGFILDNDAKPSVSINDVTPREGNSGTTNATFTVQLNRASGQTISVNAIPYNGSARASLDYTGGGVRLVFAPGEVRKTFSVPIQGDVLDELDETFSVSLRSPVNVLLGRGGGQGTILDDDTAPAFSIDDVNVEEGSTGYRVALFKVTLSAPSGKIVSVNFATANGMGRAGSDYVASGHHSVSLAPGETSQYLSVLIKGDTVVEGDETFYIVLSDPVDASIRRGRALGTILNDDVSG